MHDKRVRLFVLWVMLAAASLVGCGSDAATPTTAATLTLTPTFTPAASDVPTDTVLPKKTAPSTMVPSFTSVPTSTLYPSLTPNPTSSVAPLPLSTFTSRPDATTTPLAESEPVVRYFRSDPAVADPGDTITLEWASQGAVDAILYHVPPSGQLPSNGWNVDTTGAFSYDIRPDERNRSEFLLVVTNAAGRHADAWLEIVLRCPDLWFFTPEPEVCPTAPIFSAAAEQHFQRGTMIWVEEEDRIYVLYDDDRFSPKWDAFVDEWDEGEPDHDPSLIPPVNFFQPVRGFGLVWREYPEVRDRLGWATDEEAAFDTTIQRTTLYKYNSIYLRGLDGRVWSLGPERSSWEVVP